MDRFCRGSIENLLVGMVDDQMITPEKLKELADRISQREVSEKETARRRKQRGLSP
jgi:hypothetical protein